MSLSSVERALDLNAPLPPSTNKKLIERTRSNRGNTVCQILDDIAVDMWTVPECYATLSGSLDANRPVPFRLTPPLQSFITQIGITGPLQLCMLATARCFVQPLYGLDSILRAVLRDEYIAWKKVKGLTVQNYTSIVMKL